MYVGIVSTFISCNGIARLVQNTMDYIANNRRSDDIIGRHSVAALSHLLNYLKMPSTSASASASAIPFTPSPSPFSSLVDKWEDDGTTLGPWGTDQPDHIFLTFDAWPGKLVQKIPFITR